MKHWKAISFSFAVVFALLTVLDLVITIVTLRHGQWPVSIISAPMTFAMAYFCRDAFGAFLKEVKHAKARRA